MRRASAASMMSAENTSSLAFASPTSRGKSQVPPPSGTRPMRAKTSPNRARSEAMSTSQPSAMLQPAPTAKPSTIAMVGFGNSNRRITNRFSDSTRARPSAAVWRWAAIVLTSPPAEKCPPAPVRMTTRVAASASSSSSTESSSRRMTRSRALRASGRFRVMVATASARSTRIVL